MFSIKKSQASTVSTRLSCPCDTKDLVQCSQVGGKVRLLGRWLLKTAQGFALCNDGQYAEQLQVLVGLGKDSKKCQVPLIPADRDTESGENLNERDHEKYRRAVGQLLWLAGDRLDLRYAVTLLASSVHQPTTKDWSMLKKVVRYLGTCAIGWTRIEHSIDLKLDLHLPDKANVSDQVGGWNPLKGERKG
eukprot:1232304-Amphidinium_carterae.3